MKTITKWRWRYRRARAYIRRQERLFFPSPPEVAAARLMGARAVQVPFIRSPRTHFALSVVIPAGWYRHNYIEREVYVRCGSRSAYIDFANRAMRKGIEIDSVTYHDILEDQERDERLAKVGWQVLRVPVKRLVENPKRVLASIEQWLV